MKRITPKPEKYGKSEFPAISADLRETPQRPLWSVMIPTYNGTKYLEQTLRSVLDQDPGVEQMQIEVIDDCSTEDDPEALVKKIGQGRVSFFRQPQNLGLIGNWNSCIQRSQGYWIHILHQDDIALPGFYRYLQQAVNSKVAIGAAFCRHLHMDEHGHWQALSRLERREPGILEDWIEEIAVMQHIQFPSMVVKRSAYEKVGGFCSEAHYAADWEMWKRISAHYSVWYEPQVLACYRSHSGSETSRLARSGQDFADIRKAIEISELYLPTSKVRALSKKAGEAWALYALTSVRWMVIKKDFSIVLTRIREAIKCSISAKVLLSTLNLFGFTGKEWIKTRLSKTDSDSGNFKKSNGITP